MFPIRLITQRSEVRILSPLPKQIKGLGEILTPLSLPGNSNSRLRHLQYRQCQDDEGGNHSIVEIRALELEQLSGENGKPTVTEEKTPTVAMYF
jgi:hypothetical protein